MTKTWNDIPSLHRLYTQKALTPSEVVAWYLTRIDKLNSQLNAFLTVTVKEALALAAEEDSLLAKNPAILKSQPLFGVPVAYKDLYMTEGVKTTAASKVLENYIAQYTATAVDRYARAGAIMLGKLNCDAWAHGGSGENSDFGPTRNPWNLELVPGGSSSGSGAAVSADLCLVATGTDTGGSIRCPASFCGVTGLKPTYGRVSRYGIIAMASSLDSIGHLTFSAADSARVLGVTAGLDPHDATSSSEPVPDYSADLTSSIKGLRIGLPAEYFQAGIDPEITALVKSAVAELEKLGAVTVPVSLPHTEAAIADYYIIQPAEVSSNLARYDGIRYGQNRSVFGAEAKRRIMLGTYTLSSGYYDAYYKTAQKVRTLLINDFKNAFEQVDILIAPVMPHLPFPLGSKVADPLQMYLEDILTAPVNLAGLPSLAIPAGFSKSKLPVGMQLIGSHFSEPRLFSAAYAYQQVTDWHHAKPSL